VQEQVVQRRIAVLAEDPRDVEEVVRGDPDRDPLVDPIARVERSRAQRERRAHEERQSPGDHRRLRGDDASYHPASVACEPGATTDRNGS
jgi:hypothetical protein